MLIQLHRLTEGERQRAWESARDRVVGPEINPNLLRTNMEKEFPTWVIGLVTGLSLLVLFSAFLPSSFRLYEAGSGAFCKVGVPVVKDGTEQPIPIPIPEPTPTDSRCSLVGVATILLAETGQIVFFFALAVLGTSPLSRRIYYIGIGLSTLVSLVGNAYVAKPWESQELFFYLETFVPPLLVMAIGFTLKELTLSAISQRHTFNRLLQLKREERLKIYNSPEESPGWLKAYSIQLKAMLIAKNKNRNKDILDSMTRDEWKHLIKLEMLEDQFYVDPTALTMVETTQIQQAQLSGDLSQLPQTLSDAAHKELQVIITQAARPVDQVFQDPETGTWTAISGASGKTLGTQYSHKGFAESALKAHNRALARRGELKTGGDHNG